METQYLKDNYFNLITYAASRAATCWVNQISRFYNLDGTERPAQSREEFLKNAPLYQARMGAVLTFPPPTEETLQVVYGQLRKGIVAEGKYFLLDGDPIDGRLRQSIAEAPEGWMKDILKTNRIDSDALPKNSNISFIIEIQMPCSWGGPSRVYYCEENMFGKTVTEENDVFCKNMEKWAAENGILVHPAQAASDGEDFSPHCG